MNFSFPFRPELVDTLKEYSPKDVLADLIAVTTAEPRHLEGWLLTEPGGSAVKWPLFVNKI